MGKPHTKYQVCQLCTAQIPFASGKEETSSGTGDNVYGNENRNWLTFLLEMQGASQRLHFNSPSKINP